MKICIITEYYPATSKMETKGGVETRCFNIATRLAKNKKNQITVICSRQEGQPKKQKILGVNIIRPGPINPYSAKGNVKSRLGFAKAAYDEAKKTDADVFDGYSFISYLPIAYLPKNKKKIITYHETWIGNWIKNKGFVTGIFGEAWERITKSKDINRIIAVSETTKKELIKRGFKQKISVIYNGIDDKEYKKIKAKKIENTICVVSRLIPSKRIIDVVEAVRILREKEIKINAKIIGVGPEKENIEKMIKDLRLEKQIKLIGAVKDHADVKRAIKSSKILCHPSISEGFGIAILESCASGTPYICSDIDVLKEISRNEKGGLLFKKENPQDLAKKIELLLTDKKLYSKKIKECKEIVKFYNWDKIVKEAEKIYFEVSREK